MSAPDNEPMRDEFDTLPLWTAAAVQEVGPQRPCPPDAGEAGHRPRCGWLAETMGLGPGTRLLDSGAGLGGPAELAAREYGVSPVLVGPHAGRLPGSSADVRPAGRGRPAG